MFFILVKFLVLEVSVLCTAQALSPSCPKLPCRNEHGYEYESFSGYTSMKSNPALHMADTE